jgi:hypothetical protein
MGLSNRSAFEMMQNSSDMTTAPLPILSQASNLMVEDLGARS